MKQMSLKCKHFIATDIVDPITQKVNLVNLKELVRRFYCINCYHDVLSGYLVANEVTFMNISPNSKFSNEMIEWMMEIDALDDVKDWVKFSFEDN